MFIALGIDVSKHKLDAALLQAGKYRCKVFANEPAGWQALLAWIEAHVPQGRLQVHVCMEATGAYHEALALFLHDHGLRLSVVNPLQVKRFMQGEGVRSKTDATDAKDLARFCDKNVPQPWQAPAPAVRELQALVLRLDTLQEMRQAELNRQAVAHGAVRESIAALLCTLDEAIEEVRRCIERTVDDDPDLRQRRDLLQTVPGLGDRTIPQLLAYIGCPKRFKSVKALVAYASLAPVIRQSGSSLDCRSGTHAQGHHRLKRALYFPAMVAARHNPLVARFWQRLKAQNKPGKVIVVACMHKLLAIAFGVLRSGQPFNPQHLQCQGG